MASRMNWKSWTILVMAVTIFAVSGGFLVASNLGFKINKGLFPGITAGNQIGDNWVSLPYNNPYVNMRDLCNAFISQGLGGTNAGNIQMRQINATTGAPTDRTCQVNTVPPPPAILANQGIRIKVNCPGGPCTAPASPSNIILVGSSNEATLTPTIVGGFLGGLLVGENFISVPYHTTWVNFKDVCTSLGNPSGVEIGRINATTGSPQTCSCGGVSTGCFAAVPPPPTIVIGEALRIRKTTPGNIVGFLPPHF